jgi:hypothetical protein
VFEGPELTEEDRRSLNIVQLKRFVRSNLAEDSVLRQVIEADPDSLQVPEFVSRLSLWLRLLDKIES